MTIDNRILVIHVLINRSDNAALGDQWTSTVLFNGSETNLLMRQTALVADNIYDAPNAVNLIC